MTEIIIASGILLFTAVGSLLGFKKFKAFIQRENKQSIHDAVNSAVKDEREKQELINRVALLEQKQEYQNGDITIQLKRMNENIERLFKRQDEHLEKFHIIKNKDE